jgi:hypothetical protein
MSAAFLIGEVVTPRVPMRRPLVDPVCAVTNRILEGDQCGVATVQPSAHLTVAAVLDSGRYLLCECKSGMVLIAVADVEPLTPSPQ